MATRVHAAQTVGLTAHVVDVEVDLSRGLHAFSIVGLPDKAVEESKDRISAAIKNTGFVSPQTQNQRITVSLAPADLRKEGPAFDLPIALAYLLASKQMAFDCAGRLFIGELALDGGIRPVRGVLLAVREARRRGFREVYVPHGNTSEAALVGGVVIFGVRSIAEVRDHFRATRPLAPARRRPIAPGESAPSVDMSDVRGQETAKRGLEIAAAGGHNVLMSGPPGTGKSMLAKAFIGILPPLSFDEMLEVTAIHSVVGTLAHGVVAERPLRSPHHTASYVALVGGGSYPRPGEITLSHRGVLFLDEFPEFERRVIESLRQPLEDGIITVARARDSLTFPARFILISTMNPCPCGNLGSASKRCVCSEGALMRYRRKLSGPIIDRIDLWLEVPQVPHEKLAGVAGGESSSDVRSRVLRARERQAVRFRGSPRVTNSEMSVRDLERHAPLARGVRKTLESSAVRLDLSPRAYHRVIKLARTIADLGGTEDIEEPHIMEALQYRPKTSY